MAYHQQKRKRLAKKKRPSGLGEVVGHVAQLGKALGDVGELQALGGPVGPVDVSIELDIAQGAVVTVDDGVVPNAGEDEGGGHGARGLWRLRLMNIVWHTRGRASTLRC